MGIRCEDMEKLKLIEIQRKSQYFKYLGNEHRLGIVMYLKAKKSASVGEIADDLKISFKATSKHLAILIKGGVLVSMSDNPFVIYSLAPNLSKFFKSLISQI
jgi:DNA-binding transcriptional ArsR family regulator